jgi:hypothetical protein
VESDTFGIYATSDETQCPGVSSVRRIVGGDLCLPMTSGRRSDSDPETIAIWIDKVDFTTPRLV